MTRKSTRHRKRIHRGGEGLMTTSTSTPRQPSSISLSSPSPSLSSSLPPSQVPIEQRQPSVQLSPPVTETITTVSEQPVKKSWWDISSLWSGTGGKRRRHIRRHIRRGGSAIEPYMTLKSEVSTFDPNGTSYNLLGGKRKRHRRTKRHSRKSRKSRRKTHRKK